MKTVQHFIEKYYPDFSNSDEIAEEQDLSIQTEVELTEDSTNSETLEAIHLRNRWFKARKKILEKAIEGFINEQEATKKHSISIVWCVDDILEQANKLNIECSKEEALHILRELKENHNSNYGVTWGDISHRLDMVEFRRKRAATEAGIEDFYKNNKS